MSIGGPFKHNYLISEAIPQASASLIWDLIDEADADPGVDALVRAGSQPSPVFDVAIAAIRTRAAELPVRPLIVFVTDVDRLRRGGIEARKLKTIAEEGPVVGVTLVISVDRPSNRRRRTLDIDEGQWIRVTAHV